MKFTKSLVAAGIALSALGAQAQNLVTNGSFEDGVKLANGDWTTITAPSTALTGWTADSTIELRRNVAGTAYAGVQYVELDTNKNSSMFQNIATTLNQAYEISFAFSARPSTSTRGADTNDMNIFWGNTLLATIGGTNSTGSNNWKTYSYSVFGLDQSSTLRFSAAGLSDSYGGSLDAVSVTAVPEVETYAMMLAGLGLMGTIARRRKNKSA